MNRTHWTSYGDVFNAIVSAIHNDYAAFDAKKDRDLPRLAVRVSLYNSRHFHGDDDKFLKYVRSYLCSLGDPSLILTKADPDPVRDWSPGFSVRAGENALYVTEIFGEERLKPGDRILTIDGLTPAEFRSGIRQPALYGNTPERELWDYYLQYAAELTAETENGSLSFTPSHFPIPAPKTRISLETCAEHTLLFTLDHFEDPEAVSSQLQKQAEALAECRTLILDLRRCRGGYIDAVFPLLPWLIDRPVTISELFPEDGLFIRNSAANRKRLPDLLAKTEKTKDFVWIPYDFLAELEETILPADGPSQVFLLTDLYCRDEAEIFLQMTASLPKVHRIGRSTLGTADHQELVTLSFEDDLFFTYPAGRTKAAAEGKGIHPNGIPADITIPWTPEECTRDNILIQALYLAENTRIN